MSKTAKLSSLSIFMPAFNEEANIGEVIREAVRAVKDITDDYEVIVVDDGSYDRTGEIVSALAKKNSRIRLMRHAKNLGYGASVKTGLKAAGKEWIFFTDSDRQFHFDELPKFVSAAGKYDLVIGYRKKRMDPFHRVFVAQVLLKVWNFVLFGLTVRDADCAYKLFHRRVRDALKLETESAITVSEFLIKSKVAGFSMKQLPVRHYPRLYGKQTGGNWRVIARAAIESFHLFKELRLS